MQVLLSQHYLSIPSLTKFLAQGSLTTVSRRDLGIDLLDAVATQPYRAWRYWETESNHRISAAFYATLGFLSTLELLPSMHLKGKGQELPVFRVKW